MKHIYNVHGTTCENCFQKVRQALLEVPVVTNVNIDQENKKIEVEMESHVMLERLNRVVGEVGEYSLSEEGDHHADMKHKSSRHTFKDVAPLLGMILTVVIITCLSTWYFNQDLNYGMRIFMGSFFLLFGGLKVSRLKDFAVAYRDYDLIAKRSEVYSFIYPFLEVGLGLLFIAGMYLVFANVMTIILMSVGALGVLIKLLKREEIMCACLGTVFKVPMTWVTLGEDVLMVAMAIIMLMRF